MTSKSLVGSVQTVCGPITPDRLGVTLTHEHLLIDLSPTIAPADGASARDFFDLPVSSETLARIRYYTVPNADDARLSDVSDAIDEVNLYKQYGGGSLLDATSIGISRDPIGLARISRATGVNVIMGSSYYVNAAHPHDMDGHSEDQIVEQIVLDVTEGVDDTGIRSGVIGEVGCSWP